MSDNLLSQEEIDALLGGKQSGENPAPEGRAGEKSPSREQEKEESPPNLEMILDFPLTISVRLGEVEKSLSELRNLSPGAVLELDRFINQPVDIFVNGKLIAYGEVVVVDENFGVKITEIIDPLERIGKLRQK